MTEKEKVKCARNIVNLTFVCLAFLRQTIPLDDHFGSNDNTTSKHSNYF